MCVIDCTYRLIVNLINRLGYICGFTHNDWLIFIADLPIIWVAENFHRWVLNIDRWRIASRLICTEMQQVSDNTAKENLDSLFIMLSVGRSSLEFWRSQMRRECFPSIEGGCYCRNTIYTYAFVYLSYTRLYLVHHHLSLICRFSRRDFPRLRRNNFDDWLADYLSQRKF